MKKLVTLLSFSLLFSLSFSQRNDAHEIKWNIRTEKIKSDKAYDIKKQVTINDNLFVLKKGKRGKYGYQYYIDKYDKDLNYVNTLNFKKTDKGKIFRDLISIDGHLYVFTRSVDKKNKKSLLNAQEINIETNQFNDEIKQLANISTYGSNFSLYFVEYTFSLSPDNKNLAIIANYSSGGKNPYSYFGVSVFNSSLKKIWSYDSPLKFLDNKNYIIYDFSVSNEAEAHVIMSPLDKKKTNDDEFNFEVISYLNEGENISHYILPLDNIQIRNIRFNIDSENYLTGLGFYSEVDDSEEASRGSFFIKIDLETEKLIKYTIREFECIESDNVYSIDNLIIRDVHFMEDGSIKLIGEQYRIKSYQTVSSSGMISYHTKEDYEDIIIVSFGIDNEVEWDIRINKHQKGYSSVSLISGSYNNNLYLIYHEKGNNKLLRNVSQGDKPDHRVVYINTIFPDGEINEDLLYALAEDKSFIKEKASTQINDNTMIIHARDNNKGAVANYKIGKLLLK